MKKEISKKMGRKQGLINFPLGDFLIRMKNASMAGYKEVKFPYNKLSFGVSRVLEKEGYLTDVKREGYEIAVKLTYQKKEPVISDVKIISKPGLRVYMDIGRILEKKGSSFYIISTPKGLMTTKDAIKNNQGGEILVEIF